eukprot:TRINITY_DN9206_c0_g1_i1.p1 TRINITY_DN9206_c0_g1~~TRINITY_DN9206_c0_g1_i1.p1  ORF type:complete len:600 (+),score=237.19 TRINITY_DN9206_c0_g1_i1:119-1918(+)
MYDSLIFPAPSPSWYDLSTFGGSLLHIPRAGHDTAGLLYEARGSQRIVLLNHANAEDLGCTCQTAEALCDALQCHVLAIDYTGYGIVSGAANEADVTEDVFAAYEFITGTLGFEPENVIVAGRSIGTGPTAILAHQRPVGGVVLITPFTGIKDCVASLVGSHVNSSAIGAFASTMVGNRFPTIDIIGDIKAPIVIVHGTADEIVPYEHGTKLAAAAPEWAKLVTLDGRTHNNIPSHEIVNAMFEALLPRMGTAPGKKRAGRVVAPAYLYSVGDVTPCAPGWALVPPVQKAVQRLLPVTRGSEGYRAMVPLLVSGSMAFLNAAILLNERYREEQKAEKNVTNIIPPSAAFVLDLACALWGAPWVNAHVVVEEQTPGAYVRSADTFVTGARRYQRILERLRKYSKGQGAAAPLLGRVHLVLYEASPHKALWAEYEAVLKGARSPKDQPAVYDTAKLQFEIERYVRMLPEDCAARLCEAVDAAQQPNALPVGFSTSALEALKNPKAAAQAPSRPVTPISAVAGAAGDGASPPASPPAEVDALYCRAQARSQYAAPGIANLDPVKSAYTKYVKGLDKTAYVPCRDVPKHAGGKRGKGQDCCVM